MTTDKNTLSNDPKSEADKAVSQTFTKVQSTVSDVADEAKSQAIEITDEVKTQAKSALGSRKDMAARELNSVASAIRQTGEALDEQENASFAKYSYRMADQVERASTYLERTDVNELFSDTEDFARRQPEMFIGAAFTLGLLAARFLKSSAPSLSIGRVSHVGDRAYGTSLPRTGQEASAYNWQNRNDNQYGSSSTTGSGSTGTTGSGSRGTTGSGSTGTTDAGSKGTTGIGWTSSTGSGSTGTTGSGSTGSTGSGSTSTTPSGSTPVRGS